MTLLQLGPSKTLVVNEIPFVGEACGAEVMNLSVKAPEGDALQSMKRMSQPLVG
jgi:hypothetical protein